MCLSRNDAIAPSRAPVRIVNAISARFRRSMSVVAGIAWMAWRICSRVGTRVGRLPGGAVPGSTLTMEGVGGTGTVFIDSDGTVDVFSAPAFKLFDCPYVFNNTTSGAWFDSVTYGSNANAGTISLRKTRRVASSGPGGGAVQNGDLIGEISFVGSDGTGWQWSTGIFGRVNGTVSTGVVPMDLVLHAGTNTAAPDRLTLDSAGNIVIGTAAILTSATDGFLYLDSCNGVPVGTPTAYTGRVPIVVDTADNRLYGYNGSWIDLSSGTTDPLNLQFSGDDEAHREL